MTEEFKRWYMETITTNLIISDMLNEIETDKEYHFGLTDIRKGWARTQKISLKSPDGKNVIEFEQIG